MMKEMFEERFSQLLGEGKNIIQNQKYTHDYGLDFYIEERNIPQAQTWISSTANLIKHLAKSNRYFNEECDRILADESLANGLPFKMVQKLYGVLESMYNEWKNGLLGSIEYIVAAETFDDFIDHASHYHKANKAIEASVLASAVLEDTIKKIALKNGVDTDNKTLEPLIDNLVKADVFTSVKAKRVKSYAGVRNHAMHAEWEKIDIKDVGEMIRGTRELIESYLS